MQKAKGIGEIGWLGWAWGEGNGKKKGQRKTLENGDEKKACSVDNDHTLYIPSRKTFRAPFKIERGAHELALV